MVMQSCGFSLSSDLLDGFAVNAALVADSCRVFIELLDSSYLIA